MSFLQKQDSTKHIVVTSASGGHRPIERKVIVTTPGQLEATRQVVHTEKVVLQTCYWKSQDIYFALKHFVRLQFSHLSDR